jgi:DNA-binding MarR family transcriptional regulator
VKKPAPQPSAHEPSERVPLARLFAVAYRRLIDGLHERLGQRGYTDVGQSYGYVLLALRGGPMLARDIALLLGVTKQAASKLLEAMEGGGYVHRVPDPSDGRATRVGLTPRGRRLLTVAEEIYRELEAEWAEVIGTAGVERLRLDLTAVIRSGNDGELPPVRPTR